MGHSQTVSHEGFTPKSWVPHPFHGLIVERVGDREPRGNRGQTETWGNMGTDGMFTNSPPAVRRLLGFKVKLLLPNILNRLWRAATFPKSQVSFCIMFAESRMVEFRGLPCLKIQTWDTQLCGGSDAGHPSGEHPVCPHVSMFKCW